MCKKNQLLQNTLRKCNHARILQLETTQKCQTIIPTLQNNLQQKRMTDFKLDFKLLTVA